MEYNIWKGQQEWNCSVKDRNYATVKIALAIAYGTKNELYEQQKFVLVIKLQKWISRKNELFFDKWMKFSNSLDDEGYFNRLIDNINCLNPCRSCDNNSLDDTSKHFFNCWAFC